MKNLIIDNFLRELLNITIIFILGKLPSTTNYLQIYFAKHPSIEKMILFIFLLIIFLLIIFVVIKMLIAQTFLNY